MPTIIQGKDAPAEETLARFKKLALALKLDLVEKDYLNPLPNLHSVHLEEASCPHIYSNGKGSSYEAALCSAYGEIFERLATFNVFNEFYLGSEIANEPFVYCQDEKWFPLNEEGETDIPDDLLNETLRSFYLRGDLKLESLVDLGSAAFSRGVCALPFENVATQEKVYFPVNLLENIYGSNGMSAGNTEPEALVQALSEILERYVKKQVISQGISLPEIPPEIIAKYPKSQETLQELSEGLFVARCYDASLGGRFPVVCVVLFNQSNGTAVASFGAHPILEVALDRTLTELMQGRTFADLDGFETPTFDEDACADVTNLESHFIDSTGLLPMFMFKAPSDHNFVHWDFSGSTINQFQALRYIIKKLGFEIYIRRYSNLGIPVVRVIVPGMSEIYPVDDLIYNNNAQAIDYQEAILALPSSNESKEAYEDYLNELNLADSEFQNDAPLKTLLGILPDPQSPWDTLRVGELKCLVALKAQDYQSALTFATWTLNFNQEIFKLKRLTFYRCLIALLEIKLDHDFDLEGYQRVLEDLFGQETFSHALAHLKGEESFFGLNPSDLSLKTFKTHSRLLEIFKSIKNYQAI